MKIILSVELITPPVTGVGRYALELAQQLSLLEEVESIRYFYFGRWLNAKQLGALAKPSSKIQIGRGSLRSVLASNRLAVKAYSQLMPKWSAWRLRQAQDSVFHSPNYLLPPFPGKSVATIHDLSHIWYPDFHPVARRELLDQELPKSIQRADFLITDAESVRKEIITYFAWPEEKIAAVPLGVDGSYQPRTAEQTQLCLSALGLRHGGYSLYVGTIEPRKNLQRLMTAYSMLPNPVRQRWPLVLAGFRGWQSGDIHVQIHDAASQGWLKYLDYVPQSSLPELYSGARLFTFPSLYEGFGLPPLEAMASGVPVVTSSVSSLPEVVGDAAIMVDPLNTVALANALLQGLEDESWRAHAVASGLARARTMSWQACAQRTAEIYSSL
jgi:glycosyltransferase involved in cell wall biosynthesis